MARRLTKHTANAAHICPTLRARNVTPHLLRHTAPMRLLHAGVDTTVIALWRIWAGDLPEPDLPDS